MSLNADNSVLHGADNTWEELRTEVSWQWTENLIANHVHRELNSAVNLDIVSLVIVIKQDASWDESLKHGSKIELELHQRAAGFMR